MSQSARHQLPPGEPQAAGVGNLIENLIREAVRRIAEPGRHRDADVHAVRTAIKHLRAILRLIRPTLRGRSLLREDERLRCAARRLAFERDFFIGCRTLRRLSRAATDKAGRAKIALVLGRYEMRAASRNPAQCERAMQAVAKTLCASGNRLRHISTPDPDRRLFGSGFKKTFRQCRARMRAAYAGDDERTFHRWRACVKTLYFQLLLFVAVHPKRVGAALTRLRTLQHKLGLDHDLSVLKNTLRESPDSFGGRGAVRSVLAHARRRSKKLRRQCRLPGETIFNERPQQFARRMLPRC